MQNIYRQIYVFLDRIRAMVKIMSVAARQNYMMHPKVDVHGFQSLADEKLENYIKGKNKFDKTTDSRKAEGLKCLSKETY